VEPASEDQPGPALRSPTGRRFSASSSWSRCSIGYGSLLAADNQALRLFGALAILGEVATLAAAVTMLPAALRMRRRAPDSHER
jgi:hypothetical protein